MGVVVSNNENTVINLLRNAVGHDAASVGLPRGSINSDGDGTVGVAPSGHCGLVVRQIDVSGDGCANGATSVVASRNVTFTTNVRVRRFSVKMAVVVLNGPLEGVIHQTAIASIIDGIAGHEELLGEGSESVSGEEPLTFSVPCSRKTPAGSALALVLHGSNCALCAPIDRGTHLDLFLLGRLAVGTLGVVTHGRRVVFFSAVADLELLSRHVRKFVHSECGKRICSLKFLSLLHVVHEDPEAFRLFLGGGVLLRVLRLVGLEAGHVVRLRRHRHGGSENSDCVNCNNTHFLCFTNKTRTSNVGYS